MNKASCIKGVEVLTLFHFNEWTLKFPFSPHNTFHKFNEGATFKGGARNIEYCKQRKTSTMAHFPILVRERVNRNQCLVIINIFKAFSCEKRFKGGIWNGPKFGSQPKRVTYDVSVSRFKCEVKVYVIVDVKWSLKWAKIWSWLDNQPKLTTRAKWY